MPATEPPIPTTNTTLPPTATPMMHPILHPPCSDGGGRSGGGVESGVGITLVTADEIQKKYINN